MSYTPLTMSGQFHVIVSEKISIVYVTWWWLCMMITWQVNNNDIFSSGTSWTKWNWWGLWPYRAKGNSITSSTSCMFFIHNHVLMCQYISKGIPGKTGAPGLQGPVGKSVSFIFMYIYYFHSSLCFLIFFILRSDVLVLYFILLLCRESIMYLVPTTE